MDREEGLRFLRNACIFDDAGEDDLERLWARAREAVREKAEPDLEPDRQTLDEDLGPHLAEVSRQQRFRQVFEDKDFALLEVDKLVAFQKHVYVDHAQRLVEETQGSDLRAVTEVCLPAQTPEKPIGASFDPGRQAYTVFSPGQDLRVLGNIDPDSHQGFAQVYGFGVGFGAPYVQVVEFQDRYFLKNGYHRVYALRSQGVTHVPCVLVRGEAYADTGGAKDGFFDAELMLSDKPPTFSDFFHSDISPEVPLRPKTKAIRIQAEEITLPSYTDLPDVDGNKIEKTASTSSEVEGEGYERFEVVEEGWNIYKLEDGTVLKVRQLLKRLRHGSESAAGQVGFDVSLSEPIFVCLPPDHLQGVPSDSNHSPRELQEAIDVRDMEFELVEESPAVYETESGLSIQLQTRLTGVSRTSKYNADGDPVYLIHNESGMNVSDGGDAPN